MPGASARAYSVRPADPATEDLVSGKKHRPAPRAPTRDVPEAAPARWRVSLRALVFAAAIVVIGVGAAVGVPYAGRLMARSSAPSAAPAATFVGSGTCASCHATQSADWQKSQHRAAMSSATEQTVLGDFRDARFTHAGTTTQFMRRDGKYVVRTDGPTGKLDD